MKIHDILIEAGDDSGDYQQMQAFVRANRVGGVPADQQVALALFKELKKQQQQNQALGRELSAAEQRIDQAMQSGQLSQQELELHRTELDRERASGAQQKTVVGQLGQQYAERERASTEQIQQLAGQLEQVRNMPGVNQKAARDLEKQIKELGEKSVSADRLAELESTIAQIQTSSIADDDLVKDLVQQVKNAQVATDTRVDTVTQMRKDIERLKQVETGLEQQLTDLRDSYQETDATLWDIESQTIPAITQDIDRLKTAGAVKDIPVPLAPQQQVNTPAPPQAPTPAATPASNDQKWKPNPEAIFQKMKAAGHFQDQQVAEDQMHRAIAWATGKRP